jgi:hypothetical protein
MHTTKKRIFAPKGQKTLFSFINHEKDSNNNNAQSLISNQFSLKNDFPLFLGELFCGGKN